MGTHFVFLLQPQQASIRLQLIHVYTRVFTKDLSSTLVTAHSELKKGAQHSSCFQGYIAILRNFYNMTAILRSYVKSQRFSYTLM